MLGLEIIKGASMRFITDFDPQTSSDGIRVYPVRDYGPDEEAALRAYVRDRLWTYDMDGSNEDEFEARFESGSCYRVIYESWWEGEGDDRGIEHSVVIRPITMAECAIREAPGESVRARVPLTSGMSRFLPGPGEVILSLVVSDARSEAFFPFTRLPDGELALQVHVGRISAPVPVRVSDVLALGHEVFLDMKVPGPDHAPHEEPRPGA